MATKKPAKPTPKPKPTVKPTPTPVVAQKKSVPKPLLVVGGSMSLGSCALACVCLLMRQGGSKSGVPNVLGLRVPANAKPSGLPATMLSGIILSVCVGMVASIIFVVLTRQRRMTDAARFELQGKMLEAMRRLMAADVAKEARFARYSRAKKRVEAQNRRAVTENEWIQNPFVLPLYEIIPRFVLVGKVIGNEYATLEEARDACNKTPNATHIQLDKKTGRAVIKTILELPETFGLETSTATTLTHRCGEGYHKDMDTYIHPRFFLLNEVNRIVNREWVDITMDDLLETQAVWEKKYAELDKQCMFGSTNACDDALMKKILLTDILPAIAGFLVGGALQVFTAGLRFLTGFVIDAVVSTGVDVGLSVGLSKRLSDKESKEAASLQARLNLLKTGEAQLSNAYLGGKESYWTLNARLMQPECSKSLSTKTNKKGLWRYLYTDADFRDEYNYTKSRLVQLNYDPSPNHGPVGGIDYSLNVGHAPYPWALLEKMFNYEKLPPDEWNCDDITRSWGFAGTRRWSTGLPHPKGPNACAEADATFRFG
jgi:hypothetical protein